MAAVIAPKNACARMGYVNPNVALASKSTALAIKWVGELSSLWFRYR